jgi:hypothetical protein
MKKLFVIMLGLSILGVTAGLSFAQDTTKKESTTKKGKSKSNKGGPKSTTEKK